MINNRNPQFLIVDDFSTMRRIIRGLLKEAGYVDADEAEDGQVAFQKLQSGHFDCVITDINMPIMTGCEAAQEIRKYEKQNNLHPIPILAATGNEENLLTFYKSGINDCFAKGDDLKKMCVKIGRTVGIWVG